MKNKELRVSIISNCVYEPYLSKYLKKYFGSDGVACVIQYINSADIQDIEKNLDNIGLVIYWENISKKISETMPLLMKGEILLDDIIEKFICDVFMHLEYITNKYSGSIYIFNFENYSEEMKYIWGNIVTPYNFVDEINYKLHTRSKDMTIFDSKSIVAEVGTGNAYDKKSERRWGNPYSRLMLEKCAKEIYKQHKVIYGKPKKCIVLDCDNVLWGGEAIELGSEGICLSKNGKGRKFYLFQIFLLKLYYNGMILAICSKNDYEVIEKIFSSNPEMIIKPEMISCFKVNWKDKPSNIVDISKELNLSLDSMIFIDDLEYEVTTVKNRLPMVTTVLYDADEIYSKMEFLNLSDHFNTESIKVRNQTYQDNIKRNILRDEIKDLFEYASKLQTVINIHELVASEYARISELSYRTNKCTLGIRYTVDELEKIRKIFVVTVKDCFGNLGIVGAFGINGLKLNELVLFCLSCRALGRGVEDRMIGYIKEKFCIDYILSEDTTKNEEICKNIKKQLLT